MEYGRGGAVPSVAGVALLPNTGNNAVLLYVAVGLIAVGVAVFVASLILARRQRQATEA